MIAIHPAVQFSCQSARRIVCYSAKAKRDDKREANRRHRRVLNAVTRGFEVDPERFESEDFAAPTLSDWEIY